MKLNMFSAQTEWISLYTQSAEPVWKQERSELKNMAMLMHILDLELKKIRSLAETEMKVCRNYYARIDAYKKKLLETPCSAPQANSTPKDHHPQETMSHQSPAAKNTNELIVEPEIFRCVSPDLSRSNENIINDSTIDLYKTSPKISRKRKFKRLHTLRASASLGGKVTLKCKSPVLPQENTTPKGGIHEVIEPTPELTRKKTLSLLKSQDSRKIERKKPSSCMSTLTRMFVDPDKGTTIGIDSDDADPTFADRQDDIDQTFIDGQLGKVGKDDGGKENKGIAPNRASVMKPKCDKSNDNKYKNRDKGATKCRPTTSPEPYNKTYSGFWDIEFNVKNPGDDSDESSIFS